MITSTLLGCYADVSEEGDMSDSGRESGEVCSLSGSLDRGRLMGTFHLIPLPPFLQTYKVLTSKVLT